MQPAQNRDVASMKIRSRKFQFLKGTEKPIQSINVGRKFEWADMIAVHMEATGDFEASGFGPLMPELEPAFGAGAGVFSLLAGQLRGVGIRVTDSVEKAGLKNGHLRLEAGVAIERIALFQANLRLPQPQVARAGQRRDADLGVGIRI